MKIITSYPVIYKNNVINRGGDFSNISGSSSPADIKSFQTWYNKQSPKTALEVDGKWGKKTASAWKDKGASYEKHMLGVAAESQNIMAGLFGLGTPTAPLPENISVSSPTGEKKKGMFWDKVKGGFVAAKEAGILDAGKNLAASTLNTKKETVPNKELPPIYTIPAEKKKMSNVVKIIIAGGALVVITLIIVSVSKSKKA